jgi:hypothetical protein
MASVPSKRTNKLCTHAHHSDRSAAMAIFANGTYFVDTPYMHIRCWLHWSPLTLASVYIRYILCCQFDILGCNATIYLYVLVKVLNLKTDNLLKFVEF